MGRRLAVNGNVMPALPKERCQTKACAAGACDGNAQAGRGLHEAKQRAAGVA